MNREDVYCPACPDPDTAFRIEDVGMKHNMNRDLLTDDKVTFTVSRPFWEQPMLDHLRSRLDDNEHRQLYDLCVTHLIAAGKTAEEAARDQVQGLVDSVTRSMGEAMRRPG
jgi:hypothetical protein